MVVANVAEINVFLNKVSRIKVKYDKIKQKEKIILKKKKCGKVFPTSHKSPIAYT